MYVCMDDEKRVSSRFMLVSLIMLSIVRWFVRAKRLLSVDMCRKAVRQWHNRYCIREEGEYLVPSGHCLPTVRSSATTTFSYIRRCSYFYYYNYCLLLPSVNRLKHGQHPFKCPSTWTEGFNHFFYYYYY